ncbi:hypothetical protein FE257_004294 [Aspergillus nanangensis]|uniref:Nicotinamide N-methyltransferase n=1 Tax=Aspergillus nanangensis TaxID=2582783 RepID=A0AAD4CAU4_ASPNN|nr:hypothetical protein FE257_004294 [Aspergillus nanangensis]
MAHSRLQPHPTLRPADEAELEAEDLFTAFLPHLFPEDSPQSHGDPGQFLLYSSPRYGDLTIQVPSYPTIVVAEAVETAHCGNGHVDEMWIMKGEKVLELGAGAALPSLISVLAGASEVTITDHPSSPALTGAIAFNIERNIPANMTMGCPISIQPHAWGVLSSDPWAVANKGQFTRIIAADCYWMRSQHENLARTMKWFLAPQGRICVVAGLHTGRPTVAEFFETVKETGLQIEMIYERDLISSFAHGESDSESDPSAHVEGNGNPYKQGDHSPHTEGNGSPRTEGNASPHMEGNGSPRLEGNGSPKTDMEGNGSPRLEGNGSPNTNMEGNGSPKTNMEVTQKANSCIYHKQLSGNNILGGGLFGGPQASHTDITSSTGDHDKD